MSIRTIKSGWLLRQSTILKRWKRNWLVLYSDGNLAYYEDDSLNNREGNFSILTNGKKLETALECCVDPPEGRNYGCLMKLVGSNDDTVVIAAANIDEAMAWKLTLEQMLAFRKQTQHHHQYPAASSQTVYTTQYPCARRGYYRRYPGTTTVTTYYNPPAQGQYPVQANIPPPPAGQPPSNGHQVQQPMYYNPSYGQPMQVMYNSAGQPYYVNPQTQVITVVRDDDPYYYRRGDMFTGMAAGALLGAALWTPFLFF